MAEDKLLAAASAIDVIDLAGRIIAHPRYQSTMTPAAGVVALAHAVEKFWAIALEAEILARALAELPARTGAETTLKTHAVETQRDRILSLMAALRGEQEDRT